MNTMKRIICIVLALCMVFAIAACDGGSESSSEGSSATADVSSVDNGSSDGASTVDTSSDGSSDAPSNTESNAPSTNTPSTNTPSTNTPSTNTPSTNTPSTNTSSTKPQSDKQTSLTLKQVMAQIPSGSSGKTIELMNWNDATTAMKKNIEAFTKGTGIKVTYTTESYDTYLSKIASRVATGNPPTVVRLRDNTPQYMNFLQPITNSGFNFNDTYWDDDIMDAYTANGKLYAVNLNNSPYYQPVITFYNQTLIDRYDLEDPYELWKDGEWTWDKMHEIAEDFVDQAGDGFFGISTLFGEYLFSTGNSYFKYNGQFNFTGTNNSAIKAWQYMNKAYHDGLYSSTVGNDEEFNTGRILFLNESEIAGRTGHFQIQELKRKGTVRAVPLPAVDGQKEYYVPLSEQEAYGIPNNAANKELAPYFLRFYLDASNYDMDSWYAHETILEAVEWTRDQAKNPVLCYMMDDTAGYFFGTYVETLLTCDTTAITTNAKSKFEQGGKAAASNANSAMKNYIK